MPHVSASNTIHCHPSIFLWNQPLCIPRHVISTLGFTTRYRVQLLSLERREDDDPLVQLVNNFNSPLRQLLVVMETSHRPVRKVNSFFRHPRPVLMGEGDLTEQESVAKRRLIEVAETDNDENALPHHSLRHAVPQWLTRAPQPLTSNNTPRTQTPSFSHRRTVHVRPFQENQPNLPRDLLGPAIPQLKDLLKRLESPERSKQVKAEKKPIQPTKQQLNVLEERLRQKKKEQVVQVEDLMEEKRNSVRIRGSRSGRRPQSKENHSWFGPENSRYGPVLGEEEHEERVSKQVRGAKEARRTRTLRNLLF